MPRDIAEYKIDGYGYNVLMLFNFIIEKHLEACIECDVPELTVREIWKGQELISAVYGIPSKTVDMSVLAG